MVVCGVDGWIGGGVVSFAAKLLFGADDMDQLDLFAVAETVPQVAAVAPMVSSGEWGMAEGETFRAALRRGELGAAVDTLAGLKLVDAERVLLEAGFSVGRWGSRAAMLKDVQGPLVEAARRGVDGFGLRAVSAAAVVDVPAWHTAIPDVGVDILDADTLGDGYRRVPHRVAAEAVGAVTQVQKLGGAPLYAYVLLATAGRHGRVRLLPDDQVKPEGWSLLNPEAVRVGMLTPEQIGARLSGWLSNAAIIGSRIDVPINKPEIKVAALPQANDGMELLIKVAADSVESLRKVDVMRVLESNHRNLTLARYIADKRADLAQEVDDVMTEEFGIADWKANNKDLPMAQEATPTVEVEKQYRYAMVNRPVGIGTVPKEGLSGSEDRPLKDAPHHEAARNGVAIFGRQLTDAETKQFEMAPMVGSQDMKAELVAVVEDLGEYAEAYAEMAAEEPDAFAKRVSEAVRSIVKGYPPSVADFDAFVGQVAAGLREKVNEQGGVALSATTPEDGNKGLHSSNAQEPFMHSGFRIYPLNIRIGNEGVVPRWAVQSIDNVERERKGERQVGGDAVVETVASAMKIAEDQVRQAERDRQLAQERDVGIAEAEAKKAVNRGLTIAERKVNTVLDAVTNLPAEAGVGRGSRRQAMEKAVEQGRAIVAASVSDSAAKKRDEAAIDRAKRAGYILGLSNENIPVVKAALEARQRLKDGSEYQKPEYRLYSGSDATGGFYVISKTEFDYVQALIAKVDVAPIAANLLVQPSVLAQQQAPQFGADFDLRGYSVFYVKDGQMVSSGSVPAKGEDHYANLGKYAMGVADGYGADLYVTKGVAGANIGGVESGEPLILGMTWAQIQAKQQGQQVVTAPRPAALPDGAVRVYSPVVLKAAAAAVGDVGGVVEEVVTPDVAAKLSRGALVQDVSGQAYYAWSARHDYLETFPMRDGKPEVFAGNSVVFHLNPASKDAFPERRHDSVVVAKTVGQSAAITEDSRVKIYNPRSGVEEFVSLLPIEDRKNLSVVTAGDELLQVAPDDHFRVYEITNKALEHMAYFRALGHTVNVLNDSVDVQKVSGSWRITPKTVEMQSALATEAPLVNNVDGQVGFIRSIVAADEASKNVAIAPGGTKVNDAGEQLKANKRNRYVGVAWAELAGLNPTLRAQQAVKERVWPRPDYEALVGGGMEPVMAHVLKQVYDGLPRAAASGKTDDATLQRYVETVGRLRDGVSDWLASPAGLKSVGLVAAAEVRIRGSMTGRVSMLDVMKEQESVKAAQSALFDHIWPVVEGVTERTRFQDNADYRAEYLSVGRNAVMGLLLTTDVLVKASRAVTAGFPAKREAWQVKGISVGKVVSADIFAANGTRPDGQVISVALEGGKKIRLYGETRIAAEATAAALLEKRHVVVSKGGCLVGMHGSEEEALAAAREVGLPKRKEAVVKTIGRKTIGERVGPVLREGDVTPEKLMAEFGFRGVNFGNWVPDKERQAHLNHAFDAFCDLAEVLAVPRLAMSLDGQLGIAIGAQGSGKAAGHFVPGYYEINMTRTKGGGVLAHEWGHAVDHFLGAKSGELVARSKAPYLSAHCVGAPGVFAGVDSGVVSGMAAVVGAMRGKVPVQEEAVRDATVRREAALVDFNRAVAVIRKGYFGEASGETVTQLMGAVGRLRQGEGGEAVQIGPNFWVSTPVAEIRNLVKAQQGRVPVLGDIKALNWAANSLATRESKLGALLDGAPPVERKATEFLLASEKRDREEGREYWSTREEMFARSVEAMVADTLASQDRVSPYLVDAGQVASDLYPQGEERVAVGAAMEGFLREVRVKERTFGEVAGRKAAVVELPGKEAVGDRVAEVTAPVLKVVGGGRGR